MHNTIKCHQSRRYVYISAYRLAVSGERNSREPSSRIDLPLAALEHFHTMYKDSDSYISAVLQYERESCELRVERNRI